MYLGENRTAKLALVAPDEHGALRLVSQVEAPAQPLSARVDFAHALRVTPRLAEDAIAGQRRDACS